MKSGSSFQRNFYIFTNEDSGFEAGQKPSGHVKIEVREGKGRLHTVVQNLRAGNGRFEYVLYLLCSAGERMEAVRVGQLKSSSSKSELELSFDPGNVGQSGYSVNTIDVFAILAEYADRLQGRVLCPLAAYRNKRAQWRGSLAQLLAKKIMQPEIIAAKNASENAALNASEKADGNAAENAVITANDITYVPDNATESNVFEDSAWGIADDPVQTEVSPHIKEFAQSEQPGQLEQPEQPSQPEQPNQPEQSAQLPQQELNNINTGCVYLNGNICGAFVQSESNMASPCGTCSVCRTEQAAPELPGDLSMLKAVLDNNFEKSDPFRSKRSDYIWWKVTNPVNLNNILYQNNIRPPLMFNPVVMMAHYKYRHLIIGIFTHMNGKRYVVCGVPGMHMVDRKPFGELSTWVHTQRSKPRYGSLGYWLVYINPSDGKILDLAQQ